jgi:uncharacterized membrane protein
MPIIKSVVRHLLTFAAGGLVVVGVSEHDSANLVNALEPVISGVLLYTIGQGWSLFDKQRQ